jgi:hypothetical protein
LFILWCLFDIWYFYLFFFIHRQRVPIQSVYKPMSHEPSFLMPWCLDAFSLTAPAGC